MSRALIDRFLHDRSGNFGIMTAVVVPLMFGAAGLAIDVTHAFAEKTRLQALADAAALAAATAMADKGDMSVQEAESLGLKEFVSQMMASETSKTDEQRAEQEKKLKNSTNFEVNSTKSGSSENYDVRMTSSYDLPLTGLSAVMGFNTVKISVQSRASSGRQGNALSMYLALDESGSMAWDTTTVDPVTPKKKVKKQRREKYPCPGNETQMCERIVEEWVDATNYITKIASLKTATNVMFNELKKADPNSSLLRLGAASYDDKTKTEQQIGWGTNEVAKYVSKLSDNPDGGTDASGALTNALAALGSGNTKEKAAHNTKNNMNFERYIVFMTDGEMTGSSGVWNEAIDNKVRGICDQAKADGIKVYSIAFMAPAKGKTLLEACSSGAAEYYYEPDNMNQLVQTFGDIARKAAKTGTRLTN